MKRMRPVAMDDLNALVAMAEDSIGGITSLPPDRELLRQQIEHQAYFFVLEDFETGQVIGCSAIRTDSHFDAYQIGDGKLQLVHVTEPLSEISSLFLSREYRTSGLGHLLSYARFLFIAIHPERFHQKVVARMRGKLFEELPKRIEATDPGIGKPHPNTAPAMKMLEREGFAYRNQVDVPDAGPILECTIESLWTVKHRRSGAVKVVDQVEGPELIVGNHSTDFRACITPLQHEEEILLPRASAEALEVENGEMISYRPEAA